MKRALVMERDARVRERLERVLQDAGYAVVGLADESLLLLTLRVSPHPLVVVMSELTRSWDQPDVSALLRQVAATDLALPHAFVVLSTAAAARSLPLADPRTNRALPIVFEPSERDELLAAVDLAADSIATARLVA